jgi:MFS family permease
MGRVQVMIVAITIGLNALDGFDVLSISFASPGIAAEWGMDRARLGVVLSMELIGMFMAPAARSIADLSVWRVVTGLGIGGMLASINAVAAEFSNNRRRYLNVSLMAIGYPLGVVIGGTIAARLLDAFDWRSVFYLGAAVSAIFIPSVYCCVPESVHWLARKQPQPLLCSMFPGRPHRELAGSEILG